MSRLRDNDADFEGAVVSAAERLGLAPLFVEKDYWVTQVLRALHDQHAGAFVLKGGTSLSKGYELIERFSEDVDILIQPAKGDSAKSRNATSRETRHAQLSHVSICAEELLHQKRHV